MLLCDGQCIERRDARRLLALFYRQVFTEAADNGQLSIYDRQGSTQKEQISSVRRFHVGSQGFRWRGHHDSEFRKTGVD